MRSDRATAIVTRDSAHILSLSSRISTSQSHVVRPRWIAFACACTKPEPTGRRKLVLFAMPRGTLPSSSTPSAVPTEASVSAIAAKMPPWTMPMGWHTFGTTGIRPLRRPTSTKSSISSPITPMKLSPPAARRDPSGYVGHAADSTATGEHRGAKMGAGTWESHHAITALMFRYAECVDAADFDGIAALFRTGADHQRGRRGRDRRRRRGAQALRADESRPRRRHDPHASCQRERVRRHRRRRRPRRRRVRRSSCSSRPARCRSSRSSPVVTATRSCAPGDEWRFDCRHIIVDHVGDVREHLTFDLSSFVDEL